MAYLNTVRNLSTGQLAEVGDYDVKNLAAAGEWEFVSRRDLLAPSPASPGGNISVPNTSQTSTVISPVSPTSSPTTAGAPSFPLMWVLLIGVGLIAFGVVKL